MKRLKRYTMARPGFSPSPISPPQQWCLSQDVAELEKDIDRLKAELLKRIEPKERETAMLEPKPELRLLLRDEKPEPPTDDLKFWLERIGEGITLYVCANDGSKRSILSLRKGDDRLIHLELWGLGTACDANQHIAVNSVNQICVTE